MPLQINKTIPQFFLAFVVTAVTIYFIVSVLRLDSKPDKKIFETFGGVAVGSGSPDCMRDSLNASKVYEILSSKINMNSELKDMDESQQEARENFDELVLILSKTCCLKHDIMGPSGIIEATRYQKYSTAHDIEQVSETTARCFSKSIPIRDIDIIFEKWDTRSKTLLTIITTSVKLSDSELNDIKKALSDHMADVYDIMKSQCIKGDINIGGIKGPREAQPYEPLNLIENRTYEGYY